MPKYKGPSYEDAAVVVREQIEHLAASGGTPNAALEAIGDKFSRAVTLAAQRNVIHGDKN